jgi:hypothetical protein
MSPRKFVSRLVGGNTSLRLLATACGLVLMLQMFSANALAQGCHFDLNNPVCIPDNESGPVGPAQPVYWSAIAVSPTTLRSGTSHGQNSEAEAKQLALKNCATAASDCELVNWGYNLCFGLAVNRATHSYGQDYARSRAEAGTKALARCNTLGTKGCVVQASPCASDDVRWPSPLPLPSSSSAKSSKVDPHTIGTWEISMNPGRWVWEIGTSGTYEFHSESLEKAPSHAGTFSASDGNWSLQSTDGYTDSGTYKFVPPNSLVATGRLGTATWHRTN